MAKNYLFSTKLISTLNESIYVDDVSLFAAVNKYAVKAGYIVHPNACSKATLAWAKELAINPNSTFFKNWKEISDRSETELVLNQMLHYVTTYGVAETLGEDAVIGNGFTQNENPITLSYKDYKIISAAQPKEIFSDLYGMLESGIALNSETVKDIINFFKEYDFFSAVDLDDVLNKEAQALLSLAMGEMPKDEFGMLRVLVYAATGSTMLIKSYSVIEQLSLSHNSTVQLMLDNLTEEQMKALSHIFLRYKPIFLALKHFNAKTINRIRRLAIKNHKPLVKGFWETCLSEEDSLEYAKNHVTDISNFKKIQLMEGILYRKQETENQFYHIRNGKSFIRTDYKPSVNKEYLNNLYEILADSLIDSLKKKYTKEDGTLKTIKLPDNVTVVCPTSEKNFVGNIPAGSFVKTDKKNILMGIYWRNDWGTYDFDLHFEDLDGKNYGWNAAHKDGERILYSGDMTRAEPEAAECFYLDKAVEGSLSVYRFYGEKPKSQFRFYVAKDDCETLERNYMVDPNKIVFDCMIDVDADGEKQLGFVFDDRIYLTNESLGNTAVPNHKMSEIYRQVMPAKLKSHIIIKDLLTVAGFELVKENADIDLSQLNKADLINFFA